jgi:hypothetical protein
MAFHYSPKLVNDRLLLYLDAINTKSYPMTGATWSDLRFRNQVPRSATIVNGSTYSESSILLDGSNQHITLPQITTNTTVNNYSFGLWFKPTNTITSSNTNFYMLFEAQYTLIANAPDNYIYFLNSGGKITFGTNTPNNNLLTTTATWSSTSWYNVFCTYASSTGTKKIYVNGNLENSISGVNNSYLNTSTYFSLGVYSSPSKIWNFPGKISNMLVYNKTLSDSEVLQNYNAIKTRFGL